MVFALTLSAGLPAHAADPDEWSPPVSYYASVAGTGATLKTQLRLAMSAGHIQRSYGDFRSSAAIHDRDPGNPTRILLAYNRASVPAVWDSGATWNREHVWPQSLQPGSASNSSTGNLGDPHALRPANPSINSSRGNKPFGFDTSVGGHGSLGSHYFPGDADKGDFARQLFYSDTRWSTLGISLTDSFPSGNQMGDLSSLIAWHYLDAPDEFERRRNHTIFSSTHNPSFFTNNRNAFVDLPGVVWSVYVDQQNDTRVSLGGADLQPDGSSTLDVFLGSMFADGPAPAARLITLEKTGFDGTYVAVDHFGEAISDLAGPFFSFPIVGVPSDEATLSVWLDVPVSPVPGMVSGSIVLDNLDVTTQGGTGVGGNDADDMVFVFLDVLDRANASLEAGVDTDTLVLDLGVVPVGAPADHTIELFNLEATPLFTAAVDVVLDSVGGDTDAITTSFTEANAIPAGGSAPLVVTTNPAVAGDYSVTYLLRTYDDRAIAGAAEGEPLILILTATADASCPGDFTGASDPNDPTYGEPDGDIDGDDFFFFLEAFAAGELATCDLTGSSDPNDPSFGEPDGDCDADDFFRFLEFIAEGCG